MHSSYLSSAPWTYSKSQLLPRMKSKRGRRIGDIRTSSSRSPEAKASIGKVKMTPTEPSAYDRDDGHAPDLSDRNQTIRRYGEVVRRSYESADRHVDLLTKEGFEIEAGSGGMPVAFAATYRRGDGLVISGYVESDGLSKNCQKAATDKGPRDGQGLHAGSHTAPHSAVLTNSLEARRLPRPPWSGDVLDILNSFGERAEDARSSKRNRRREETTMIWIR